MRFLGWVLTAQRFPFSQASCYGTRVFPSSPIRRQASQRPSPRSSSFGRRFNALQANTGLGQAEFLSTTCKPIRASRAAARPCQTIHAREIFLDLSILSITADIQASFSREIPLRGPARCTRPDFSKYKVSRLSCCRVYCSRALCISRPARRTLDLLATDLHNTSGKHSLRVCKANWGPCKQLKV